MKLNFTFICCLLCLDLSLLAAPNKQPPDGYIFSSDIACIDMHYDEALSELNNGIAEWPESLELYEHRGYLKYQLDDFDGAWTDASYCLHLIKEKGLNEDFIPYFLRALVLEKMDNFQAAHTEIFRALAASPHRADIYTELAHIIIRLRGPHYIATACDYYNKAASIFIEEKDLDGFNFCIQSMMKLNPKCKYIDGLLLETIRNPLYKPIERDNGLLLGKYHIRYNRYTGAVDISEGPMESEEESYKAILQVEGQLDKLRQFENQRQQDRALEKISKQVNYK